MIIYYVARFFLGVYFRIVYRVKITGKENIPKKGCAVICSNHLSAMDPIALGVLIKRPISFLAKKELFRNKILGSLFLAARIIPVDRSKTDAKAYKTAIEYLKAGRMLGIFVQGTRFEDSEVKEAKSGAVLFAIKGEANIIPVGITANYRFFSKVTINMGEPFDLSEHFGKKLRSDNLSEISEQVAERINKLTIHA